MKEPEITLTLREGLYLLNLYVLEVEQNKNVTERASDVRMRPLLTGLKKVNREKSPSALHQADHLIWI